MGKMASPTRSAFRSFLLWSGVVIVAWALYCVIRPGGAEDPIIPLTFAAMSAALGMKATSPREKMMFMALVLSVFLGVTGLWQAVWSSKRIIDLEGAAVLALVPAVMWIAPKTPIAFWRRPCEDKA